jgi:hypothetical protein
VIARTSVTVKPPRSVVPPVFIGLNFSSPLEPIQEDVESDESVVIP